MTITRISVAMTGEISRAFAAHLLRADGQEDVCLAVYQPSTGVQRSTALVTELILPERNERRVHGNASFTGDYVVRAAMRAAAQGGGVVVLHSHPGGTGWQSMSILDADAERSYAYLAHEMTGHELVGLTLAGSDHTWSARSWTAAGVPRLCESVRVVGEQLVVSWNSELRPAPRIRDTQVRTVSGWGRRTQDDIARLRVLVVGAGSVGLEVAIRLAATGIQHIGVMDFDTVEMVNLDRLIGATPLDALVYRSKADLARRLVTQAATAEDPKIAIHDLSVCEPEGYAVALDYDVVFSCVDRPWPRAVLNTLAYADLIPVLDGGIHIDPFADEGMRNATWRSHVMRPGRPCLVCIKQLDMGSVPLDRDGLLDDSTYIAGSDRGRQPGRQNVAALSVSVAATLLAQFVSLVAAPGGLGEPGALQYSLSTHTLEHLPYVSLENCFFEAGAASGDHRVPITGPHSLAEDERAHRVSVSRDPRVRVVRFIDASLSRVRNAIQRIASGWSSNQVDRPAGTAS